MAQPPPRTVAAVEFAIDAYTGVKVRPGKGLPHAEAVAGILRADGADEGTQVAALLHDVVEDTSRSVEDVRATFGDRVAGMVAALSEDASIKRYPARKRALRSQIAASEAATTNIALADKIASLRHAAITGGHISARKLSHYRATLRIAQASGASPRLVAQLEQLLDPV